MRRARAQQGFTLIEMIIVMVLIGILTTIFAVNLKGKDDIASDASVQSALVQAGQAEERYAGSMNTYYAGSVSGLPSWVGFSVPSGVTLTFKQATQDTYCVEAYPTGKSSDTFSIKSGEPVKLLTCAQR